LAEFEDGLAGDDFVLVSQLKTLGGQDVSEFVNLVQDSLDNIGLRTDNDVERIVVLDDSKQTRLVIEIVLVLIIIGHRNLLALELVTFEDPNIHQQSILRLNHKVDDDRIHVDYSLRVRLLGLDEEPLDLLQLQESLGLLMGIDPEEEVLVNKEHLQSP
jgi:hypothetical protein